MADYKNVHEQKLIYANFMNNEISTQKQETIHLKRIVGYKAYRRLFNTVRGTYYPKMKEIAHECFYVSSNYEEKAMNMLC